MRIGLVLLLLFIAGCGGSSTVYVPEVYEGQDGIVIEFVDSPPETVLEKQEFPLNLEVHNKGAHDITNGIISLIVEDDYVDILGWDGIISTTTKMSSFSLEGRSSYNIEGDKLFGTIMFQAKTLEEMTETHTVFLGVNVCYDYKTYFSDEVCIDADIYNTKNFEKTCEAKDLSSGGGQGAPVGVTHVETIMYTKSGNLQPRFKVTITNLGDGEAYVSGKTAAACSSSGLVADELNSVSVSKALLSTNTLNCMPNPVRLTDGTGVVVCDLETPLTLQSTNYVTLLNLELSYGYTQNDAQLIEIRRMISEP